MLPRKKKFFFFFNAVSAACRMPLLYCPAGAPEPFPSEHLAQHGPSEAVRGEGRPVGGSPQVVRLRSEVRSAAALFNGTGCRLHSICFLVWPLPERDVGGGGGTGGTWFSMHGDLRLSPGSMS